MRNTINSSKKITIYYGDAADLADMPTTTKEGTGKYNCGCAEKYSLAHILSSSGVKVYMLRSTGWIDVTKFNLFDTIM